MCSIPKDNIHKNTAFGCAHLFQSDLFTSGKKLYRHMDFFPRQPSANDVKGSIPPHRRYFTQGPFH